MLITIAICTYNRAELLRRAIQSIVDQDGLLDPFEVIVIDNNSNDHTQQVFEAFRSLLNIRYYFEANQGLSHARNRAMMEAQGEYVGYLDDDASAPRHWVKLAHDIVKQHSPMAFGGPVRGFHEAPPPDWFPNNYTMDYESPGPLDRNKWLFGGNLFIRRSVLFEIGGFPTNQGMKGLTIAYGEESYVIEKIRELHPSELIFAHPELYIHHLIRAEKTRFEWMMRASFARGRSELRHEYLMKGENLDERTIMINNLLLSCRGLFVFITKLVVSPIRWNTLKCQYPNMQSYIARLVFMYLAQLGRTYESFVAKNNKENHQWE